MSATEQAISKIAWQANTCLSDSLAEFDKARAVLQADHESSSAAVVALASIGGDDDVIRRGHELSLKATIALNSSDTEHRDALVRQRDEARATLTAVREYVQDNGSAAAYEVLAILDAAPELHNSGEADRG